MRLRHWRFFEPIYMADISVYCGPHAAFRRAMTRRFGMPASEGPPPGGQALEHTSDAGSRYYVIWIPSFEAKDSNAVNSLAHETMHVTLFVLMTRGINATKDDQEPYCYFHGWLFEQCWKRLRRRR